MRSSTRLLVAAAALAVAAVALSSLQPCLASRASVIVASGTTSGARQPFLGVSTVRRAGHGFSGDAMAAGRSRGLAEGGGGGGRPGTAPDDDDVRPRGFGRAAASGALGGGAGFAKSAPPAYRGGPIMSSGINVYIIWYGGWSAPEKAVVLGFLASLSTGAPPGLLPAGMPTVQGWWDIQTGYTDSTGAAVSAAIAVKGQLVDNYSLGKGVLTDDSINSLISTYTAAGQLPYDADSSLYVVLTSADVVVREFCMSAMCGYHTWDNFGPSTATLKYVFVGNAQTQCATACTPYGGGSPFVAPHGDNGLDGMVSILAHELAEAANDPLISAWGQPSGGDESADLCSWQFGTTYATPSGAAHL
eukprot:SM000056S17930  [mRNA]  locus=s56:143733:145664:- [translate_table: standard]